MARCRGQHILGADRHVCERRARLALPHPSHILSSIHMPAVCTHVIVWVTSFCWARWDLVSIEHALYGSVKCKMAARPTC